MNKGELHNICNAVVNAVRQGGYFLEYTVESFDGYVEIEFLSGECRWTFITRLYAFQLQKGALHATALLSHNLTMNLGNYWDADPIDDTEGLNETTDIQNNG
jgi:hypothetical protein